MIALTHAVTASLARCELTFLARQPIDVAKATLQHGAYCELLSACGAEVQTVSVSPEHPDAVFVEDAVVVLDEIAIATVMGTPARRSEVERLVPIVAEHRAIERIELPATLEGGDVLRIGRVLYVGESPRTNAAGIEALRRIASRHGYRVIAVPVHGCLHLKTACTALDAGTVLANPAWFDVRPFSDMKIVAVAPGEPFAANVLHLGGVLCASAAHPRTLANLRSLGYRVRSVDIAELEKAEAGMTCLSVVIG